MKRLDRGSIIQWAGILAVLVLIGWTLLRVQIQDAQVDALFAALGDEQSAAEARGDDPVAPDPEELIEDPDYTGPQGPQGPPGPPPTDEAVAAAVESYFLEHPVEDGKDAAPAQIAAAVSNYLTENPPERGPPGPSPSAEQVAAAVLEYLTANPPPAGPAGPTGPQGETGADGEDGQPPTPEEIAAEVRAYIEEHPLPMCPAGSSAEPLTVLTTSGATDVIACVTVDQEEN